MKIRLITGTCYIAVLLVFFLLKIFVSDLFFDALILRVRAHRARSR